jgi:hypothetical protein
MALISKVTRAKWFTGFVLIIVLLLIFRVGAPHAIQYYVNQQIKDTQGITGHVGDVDLYYAAVRMLLTA